MPQYKTTYNKSHALVVGIDEYDHVRGLENAVRGAYAVADLFRQRYGFQITQLSNDHATRDEIFGWFTKLEPQLDPDDRVFIYFAGHGLTRRVPNDGLLGYLALTSTKTSAYESAIKIDDLLTEANLLTAKHVLVVLDACFTGLPLIQQRAVRPPPDTALPPQKLAELLISRPVRFLIAAGGAEPVDDNGAPTGTDSLFTYHLLTALQGALRRPDQPLRAKELALFLEAEVAASPRSSHKPHSGPFGYLGDGDFVFEVPREFKPLTGSQLCEVEIDPLLTSEVAQDIAVVRDVLKYLRRAAKVRVLERITTGRSGSSVWLLNATDAPDRPPSAVRGLHYCKVYRTRTGNEAERYELVRETSIGKYVPELVDNTPVIDGWMASVYAVAHQTTLRGSQPLSRLILNNIAAAKSNLDGLVRILSAWNPPPRQDENSHPQLLAERLLQRYIRGSDAGDEGITKRIESVIPDLDATTPAIQFGARVLPNPLAYLASAGLWQVRRSISWPLGHAHGDLHSNNVICPEPRSASARSITPAVIDFDNFEIGGCMFFDIAYLELDLAMKMLAPSAIDNRRLWLDASAYLVRSIRLPDFPALPAQFLPLNVLLIPLRNMVAEIVKQQPGDFEVAFWVTRMAAGMNYARKRKVNNSERRLALLLAADSLQKSVDELGTTLAVAGRPLWIDWEEDSLAEGGEV